MVSFPIFVCANKLARVCDGGGARNGRISRCHRAGLNLRLQLALSSQASSKGPVEYRSNDATGSLEFARDDGEDSSRMLAYFVDNFDPFIFRLWDNVGPLWY